MMPPRLHNTTEEYRKLMFLKRNYSDRGQGSTPEDLFGQCMYKMLNLDNEFNGTKNWLHLADIFLESGCIQIAYFDFS